jgi:hypothetical protein
MVTIVVSIGIVSMSAAVLITGMVAWHVFLQNSLRPTAIPKASVTEAEIRQLVLDVLRTSSEQSQRLADKGSGLWNVARQTPALPYELLQAIAEIRDDAKALAQALARMEQSKQRTEPEPFTLNHPLSLAKSESPALTRQELGTLAPAASQPKSELTTTERYQFNCSQRAAPWVPGEPLPIAADFQPVKCRDVSAGGISFFWPDKPDFDHVVIAIGTAETPIYMAAQIVHSKAVFMFGEVGYLIGCKFTKRIAMDAAAGRTDSVVRELVEVG